MKVYNFADRWIPPRERRVPPMDHTGGHKASQYQREIGEVICARIEAGDDLNLDGFVAAMAEARAWLAARTEAEFAGRAEVPLTFMIGNGMEPTLP